MKYLDINSTKHIYDLCTKNCKRILRGIKADLNERRALPCSSYEDLNVIKILFCPKSINSMKSQ